MSNMRIANRYAEALMTAAEELHLLTKVSDDLAGIRQIIQESHEFQLFLKSPVIKAEKKRQVFEATFTKSVQPLTLEFLSLLAKKGREDTLPSITAAADLSNQQTTQLEKRFEAYSKKKVRIAATVDKQLIGGFVVRIGDTVFDGSVKRQLELLRHRFVEEIP
jgi:F-type H+-transporting ATPase subunit delta